MSTNVTQRKTAATNATSEPSTATRKRVCKRNWFWIVVLWCGAFDIAYGAYQMLPHVLAGKSIPSSSRVPLSAVAHLGQVGRLYLYVMGLIPDPTPREVLFAFVMQLLAIPNFLLILAGPPTPCKIRVYRVYFWATISLNVLVIAYTFTQSVARGLYSLTSCVIHYVCWKIHNAYVYGTHAHSRLPYYWE